MPEFCNASRFMWCLAKVFTSLEHFHSLLLKPQTSINFIGTSCDKQV